MRTGIGQTWTAKSFQACFPPEITVTAGTGSTGLLLPERSAICLYNGTCKNKEVLNKLKIYKIEKYWLYSTSFSEAPALQAAIDTANMALAPSSACKNKDFKNLLPLSHLFNSYTDEISMMQSNISIMKFRKKELMVNVLPCLLDMFVLWKN